MRKKSAKTDQAKIREISAPHCKEGLAITIPYPYLDITHSTQKINSATVTYLTYNTVIYYVIYLHYK
jgi:hypothetical protein